MLDREPLPFLDSPTLPARQSRIGTKPTLVPQFGTRTLTRFSAPFPHLALPFIVLSYYHFRSERSTPFQVPFRYRFRRRPGLHSSRIERGTSAERCVLDGGDSRSDDKEAHTTH